MRKWMEKVSRWKFDKKMQLLVTVSIIATTLIVLVVSTISSVTSMKIGRASCRERVSVLV